MIFVRYNFKSIMQVSTIYLLIYTDAKCKKQFVDWNSKSFIFTSIDAPRGKTYIAPHLLSLINGGELLKREGCGSTFTYFHTFFMIAHFNIQRVGLEVIQHTCTYSVFLLLSPFSSRVPFILLLFRLTKTTLDCFANEANLNKCCFPSQKLLL